MSVDKVINNVVKYTESNDFAGYDPYDALNSPVLRAISSRSKWLRMAFLQFFRRFPINLRPFIGVAKGHNPKAIGLFLEGYAKLFALEQNDKYLQKTEYLLNLLDALKCKGFSGNCWGYNFDWQSKAAYRPKGTPTLVNTAFIGHALLDCFELTHNHKALEMALPIKDFMVNDLNRKPENGTFCFSYTPVDEDYVHNANMLGASLLIRLQKNTDDPVLVETAMESLAYSMKHQHDDGSWYYAETDIQRWIDSFHTGFNLQALRSILQEGYAQEYKTAYQKGVDFYAGNFFLADGTPKYYHDRIYPIDIHSPAQAIYFFSGMGKDYKDVTEKILNWTQTNMLSPKGYFYFRKNPWFTNKIPYMRWSQAWGFHALTEYLLCNYKTTCHSGK